MQIKKIRIQNYRSFEDSGDQAITKLFALIGKNNSGKSAFINAIECVWGIRKITPLDVHKDGKDPVRITTIVEEYDTSSEEAKQTEIVFEYHNGETKWVIDGKKELKKFPTTFPKLLVIPAIRNPQEQTTAGKDSFLKDLLAEIVDLQSKETPSIEKFKAKEAQSLSLDEIKSLLIHKTSIQLRDIEKIVSGHFQQSIEDDQQRIIIEPDGDLAKAIRYATKIGDPALGALGKVDALNCGTGLQSMLIMALLQSYADLQKQENAILLIEEPEVYLHPELQRKMFLVLRKIAKRTQVVYTTHSPIMISDLWDNSVRLIARKDGKSYISEIDIDGVVRELGIRYEDILNPKAVVFVEGLTDTLFYKRLIEIKYPSIASSIDNHIKFVETGNYETIHIFALMSILLSSNVNAKYFMLVDGDGRAPGDRRSEILERIKKRVRDHKINVDKKKYEALPNQARSLEKYSIESYFLDEQLLKGLDPGIKSDDIKYFLKHQKTKSEACAKTVSGQFDSMKPKLLFEDPATKHMAKFEKAYGNDERFLSIRAQIVKAWTQKKKSGHAQVASMITEDAIKIEILKEPIGILEEILKSANIT